MLDEYNYWTTYISHDERDLKAVWGSSGHRQDEEEQGIEWNNSTNLSPSNDTSSSIWTSNMMTHAYLETMLVFLFVLVLYFMIICCQCQREREITKRDVDKSVITKRVLPHGQSRNFNNISEDETRKNCRCTPRFIVRSCCSKKKLKRKQIHPYSAAAAETASEILDVYRGMSTTTTKGSSNPQLMCAHCNLQASSETSDNPSQASNCNDAGGDIEIALAEKGLCRIDSNQLTCPICFETFVVEENVTWSRIGHCRHVFHYDCILPWAVLGNYECPVCRAAFWSKSTPPTRCCLPLARSERKGVEMKRSKFCVQHGLVSP